MHCCDGDKKILDLRGVSSAYLKAFHRHVYELVFLSTTFNKKYFYRITTNMEDS